MNSPTATWQRDLSTLLERPTEYFSDVKWKLAQSDRFVHAHKAIVFARAPGSFLSEYVGPEQVEVKTAEMFQATLEYIYTARRAETVRFLYSSFALEGPESGTADVEKLRDDLVYMWRSCLFYDLSVHVQDSVFSTHRFILSCRSEFLRSALRKSQSDAFIVLPSPPFTPASTHFLLGFLYSGTLDFSQRSFDLSTAFAVYDSAAHVKLPELQLQVQERISVMCEAFTGPHPRIARVLKWANGRSPTLEQKARKIVAANFDSMWPHLVSAQLTTVEANFVLSDIISLLKAETVIPILRQLMIAQSNSRDLIMTPVLSSLESKISDFLKIQLLAVLNSKSCESMLNSPAFNEEKKATNEFVDDFSSNRIDNIKILERLMVLWKESMSDFDAVQAYQTIVGNLLIRETPLCVDYRNVVEETKIGIIRYIANRWQEIRAAGGFSRAESWVVSEIGSEIEQSTETLLLTPKFPQFDIDPRTGRKKDYAESFNSSMTRRSSVSTQTVRNTAVESAQADKVSIKSTSHTVRTARKSLVSIANQPSPASRVAEARIRAAAQSRADASVRAASLRIKSSASSANVAQISDTSLRPGLTVSLKSVGTGLRAVRSFSHPANTLSVDKTPSRARNLSSNFSSEDSQRVKKSVPPDSQTTSKSQDKKITATSQIASMNMPKSAEQIISKSENQHGRKLQLSSKMPTHAAAITSKSIMKIVSSSSSGQVDLKRSLHKGSNLDCGIPVIVSCHSLGGEPLRRNFKAHLRYLGELAGEIGPWVGVEVHPAEQREKGYSWSDGTLHGVRYFFPNTSGSEDHPRELKKRRVSSSDITLAGRSRQSKVESGKLQAGAPDKDIFTRRCLFVRPSSIVWVVSPEEIDSFS